MPLYRLLWMYNFRTESCDFIWFIGPHQYSSTIYPSLITLDFILKRYMKLSKSRPMLQYETRGESVKLNKNSKILKRPVSPLSTGGIDWRHNLAWVENLMTLSSFEISICHREKNNYFLTRPNLFRRNLGSIPR